MYKEKILRLAPFIVLPIFLFISFYTVKNKTFFNQKASDTPTIIEPIKTPISLETEIKSATSFILGISAANLDNYANKSADLIVQDKVNTSAARKEKMIMLLEKDVLTFLGQAIPEKVVTNLSANIKNNFEKELDTIGEVENIILDNADMTEYKIETYIKVGDRRFQAYSLNNELSLLTTGTKINIKGYQIDNKIAVSSFAKIGTSVSTPDYFEELVQNDTTVASAVPSIATPLFKKRVAVVLVNFEDNPARPWSAANVQKWTFGDTKSIATYYSEASFERLKISGDVFDWITLPIKSANKECNFNYEIADKSKEMLLTKGIDLNKYDYVVHAFPPLENCLWSGRAELKGRLSWINGQYASMSNNGVVAHELGHSMGAHHSNSLYCMRNNTRVAVDRPENCRSIEYGDDYSIMGHAAVPPFRHFNIFHKGQLGWLLPKNTAQVKNSGTFNIYPMEKTLPTNRQTIRIPTRKDSNGVDMYYYLEYRRPFGVFDNYKITDNVVNGVTIRLAPAYNGPIIQSNLIDTNPKTNSSVLDDALSLGKVFTDTYRGVKIKVVNLTENYATVEYTKSPIPCERSKPRVSLTPIAGWGVPGAVVSYSLNITNLDLDSCGDSKFEINPTLFSGWSQYPNNLTAVIKPGETYSQKIMVNSTANTPAGYYGFSESITHGNDSRFDFSINANLNVYISDYIGPAVTFVTPYDKQEIFTNTKIRIDLSDNTSVSYANLYYDFGNYICDLLSPTTCTFNFMNLPQGTHSLRVVAADVAGNVTEKTIMINIVRGMSPTPSPFTPVPSISPRPTATPTPLPTSTPM